MIGHEENQEDVSFKVTDRRKFNPDGSVREGVVIDEPKPVPAAVPETPAEQINEKEVLPEVGAGSVDEPDHADIPAAMPLVMVPDIILRWSSVKPCIDS